MKLKKTEKLTCFKRETCNFFLMRTIYRNSFLFTLIISSSGAYFTCHTVYSWYCTTPATIAWSISQEIRQNRGCSDHCRGFCKRTQDRYLILWVYVKWGWSIFYHAEHKKRLFRKKLHCVKTAWTLVKEKLPEYGK